MEPALTGSTFTFRMKLTGSVKIIKYRPPPVKPRNGRRFREGGRGLHQPEVRDG